jgi:hypothetical protein
MKHLVTIALLAALALLQACHSSSSSGGGSDSGADADTDADSDSDSDTDSDTEDWCNCYEQGPETAGDCDAAEELPPATTEISAEVDLFCWYAGPSTPEAEAEVEYPPDSGGCAVVFTGQVGWDDFVAQCLEDNPTLTEDDIPAVDFATQRAAYFHLMYEWDCTYDGSGQFETRIGDLADDTVQLNGYLYNTGTNYDPCLEGFGWEAVMTVVVDTTGQLRVCCLVGIEPS